MSSTVRWVSEQYDTLVLKYAKHWVLIKDSKVLFSDRRFDVVQKRAQELCGPSDDCVIEYIDSGDAAFYDSRISYQED